MSRATASEESSAPRRLRRWLELLIVATRAHVETLGGQFGRTVADGAARGGLVASDPATMGRAILNATARFHNPAHASEWVDPGIGAVFEDVWSLTLYGLSAQDWRPNEDRETEHVS